MAKDSPACPQCSATSYHVVSADQSRAPGRVAYRTCTGCGTNYIPPESGRVAGIVFGFALSALFVTSGVWVLINSRENTTLGVFLSTLGAVAGLAAVLAMALPSTSTRIEIDADAEEPLTEHGKPSPELQEWLGTEASSTGVARRFVLPLAGRILAWLGGFLALAAGVMTVGIGQGNADFGGVGQIVAICFVLGVIGLAGLGLRSLGKGLGAPKAAEVLRRDGRRPVLLLRSFADDRVMLWKGSAMERKMNPLNLQNTLEDTIATVFKKVGPVVAVGKPGERLPPSGAARAWLADDEWQKWIRDLIQWSQRVVMILGDPMTQDGLAWETEQIFSLATPQKTVIVIPPNLTEEVIQRRWAKYAAIARGRMPPYQANAIAIRYSSGWTAHTLFVKEYRKELSEQKYNSFKMALEGARDWMDSCETVTTDCSRVSPPDERRIDSTPSTDAGDAEDTSGSDTDTKEKEQARPLTRLPCPHCQTRVIRTRDGECPACRRRIPDLQVDSR